MNELALFALLCKWLETHHWYRDGDDPGTWRNAAKPEWNGQSFGYAVQAQLEAGFTAGDLMVLTQIVVDAS